VTGKKITVTPPAVDAKYYTAAGTATLLVSDGNTRTITKPLYLSCPAYTPPEPLGITFEQPPLFGWGGTEKVGFTTQGNAVAVKVLDVPTGWTVTRTGTVNAGTFTITAPAPTASPGEAFVFVSDAAGNTVMRTLELALVPTTLCTQCCYNGSTWTDCYVTTNAYPFDDNTTNTKVEWSGNGKAHYSGARSDKNGRANTAAISSQGGSAVQICKDLGANWYLPAYEELENMSAGSNSSYPPLNSRAGAGILTNAYYWSSTELYDNGGRRSANDQSVYYDLAVIVYTNGTLEGYGKTTGYNVRCAWRP
jgi:hypothetical protein